MTPTVLALVLALPLLCACALQNAGLVGTESLNPIDILRRVSNDDNCNRRKFAFMSVSETKRRAHNACAYAYQSFWELTDDERKSCIDPQDPACRWFYREEKGFYRACSFVCRKEMHRPMDFLCFTSGTRNVPLAKIVLSIRPAANTEIPVDFSNLDPNPQPQPPPPYRPPPQAEYRPQPQAEYRPQPTAEYNPQPTAEYRPPPQAEYRPQPTAEYRPPPQAEYWPQIPAEYWPPPPPEVPRPRPPPPARVQSDVDQKADLFIKNFHDRMEAKRNFRRGWSITG